MLEAFDFHNLFRKSPEEFLKSDPNLSTLSSFKFVHHPLLEQEIPVSTPGIYILTGGRQVGKTTLLKLIMKRLVGEKIGPGQIQYIPCDTIGNFQQLLLFIEEFEEQLDRKKPFFLFLDEITYVTEWDRTIKSLADRGFFKNGSVVISGSDSVLLKEAMMRFPGRRGAADQADFHLHPLSFFDTVSLYEPGLAKSFIGARQLFCNTLEIPPPSILPYSSDEMDALYSLWERYLHTGGFIRAINNYASDRKISKTVYQTYLQWILGDLLKRGKREDYARDLFCALIERLGSQITWHNLAAFGAIEHHQTIADYIALLERMDVLTVYQAFREDKRRGSPKKARKVYFADPFIFHAVNAWVKNSKDPDALANQSLVPKNSALSSLVETTMNVLARRTFETYYIKGDGEVDMVLLGKKSFLPIEIKWSVSPNRNELKQLLKYKNGIVATRGRTIGTMEHLKVVPIPLLALFLG